MFDFSIILEYYPLFLKGFRNTVLICIAGVALGLAWGLVLHSLSKYRFRAVRLLYRGYVTVFRGTPLLVQLFLLFYGGPHFGLRFSAIATGILGLTLYSAAYFAEIYRAGFQSIPKGQIEACQDLGFTKLQTMFHVQLPQMLTLITPSVINQTILVVKESAILSIITVPELTTAAVKVSTQTFSMVEPYVVLAGAYWLIVTGISKCCEILERKQMRYLSR